MSEESKPVIGNGKSPLRTLLGQFVYLNTRGITVNDAFLGTRYKGLKWERRHVQTALNNMNTDGQITARWENGERRFYPPSPSPRLCVSAVNSD